MDELVVFLVSAFTYLSVLADVMFPVELNNIFVWGLAVIILFIVSFVFYKPTMEDTKEEILEKVFDRLILLELPKENFLRKFSDDTCDMRCKEVVDQILFKMRIVEQWISAKRNILEHRVLSDEQKILISENTLEDIQKLIDEVHELQTKLKKTLWKNLLFLFLLDLECCLHQHKVKKILIWIGLLLL
jgi:hypothetical protein